MAKEPKLTKRELEWYERGFHDGASGNRRAYSKRDLKA